MANAATTLVNAGDRFHQVIGLDRHYLLIMVNGVYNGGTVAFSVSPNGDNASLYIPILGDPLDYTGNGVESGRVLTANQGAIWYFSFPPGAFTDFQMTAVTAMGGSLSVYPFLYPYPLDVTTAAVGAGGETISPLALLQGIYYGLENMRVLIANGLNQTQDYRENALRGSANVPTFDA